MQNLLKLLFLLAIFLGGLYFYINYSGSKEGLTTMNGEMRCPNLLIQKGSKFYLYNSNISQVPGVNPIEFNNLEEYVEFLEWQRGAGIRCPVLYVQNTYDAQGNRVYIVRPSVTELQGGLPPTVPVALPTKNVLTSPTNPSISPTISPTNPSQAYYTQPIPQMNENENLLYSDNAMDDNWGGAAYTKALVDAGYYSGNEVSINVP